jgi:serine phosphatase RsbU (regulator of sigma subunit)
MLSDGMPELQNINDEMYGYDRLQNILKQISEKSSEEIVADLMKESRKWSKDRDPDDDITFVVVKVK